MRYAATTTAGARAVLGPERTLFRCVAVAWVLSPKTMRRILSLTVNGGGDRGVQGSQASRPPAQSRGNCRPPAPVGNRKTVDSGCAVLHPDASLPIRGYAGRRNISAHPDSETIAFMAPGAAPQTYLIANGLRSNGKVRSGPVSAESGERSNCPAFTASTQKQNPKSG